MLPASWSLRTICTLALLALSVPLFYGQAHTVQAPAPLVVEGLGKGAVLLDGRWQFHLGDDPAWANPAFDDSLWEQLTADKPWGEQGHFAYTGFAWYRRRVDLSLAPGASPDIGIYVPQIDTAYEIYWNGRLIGHRGKLPPHPVWLAADSQIFTMGTALRGVIAVRAWKAMLDSTDNGLGGGFTAPMLIGNQQTLGALKAQDAYQRVRATMLFVVLYSLFGLLGLVGFGLWLRDRSQTLLLWAASYFAFIYGEVVLGNGFLPGPGHIAHGLADLCNVAVNISLWNLTCWLLDLRGNARLMRLTRIAALVLTSAGILHALDRWFLYRSEYELTAQICDAILTAVIIPLALWNLVPVAVAVLSHRKLEPSRWLFACFTTFSSTFYMVYVASAQGARFTHWTLAQTLWDPIFEVVGSAVNIQTIADSCVLVSLVYAIYRSISESRKRQAALKQEYRNARAVQQVLIPDAIPSIPGFSIESIYKPAGEVGGDFFQILATPNGGVLAVIGDVSGKGMPAAMTVSLLVGTVRTLAHYTQSPGEILAAMNQRMLARSSGGFTTCLVLRADLDGLLTIANAGHIAPYLAGQELLLENGLPLGLSAESTYPESTFQLAPEAQLTLLTDGVVEARDKDGALFGFERTAAISRDSAERVAQAAQAFGQDDDITVLTLTLMPQQKVVAA